MRSPSDFEHRNADHAATHGSTQASTQAPAHASMQAPTGASMQAPTGAMADAPMHAQTRMPRGEGRDAGWIEVVCGSMFSGKTEELLRRLKRARLARQSVRLFKPRVDNRYDEVKVVSHEGLTADAMAVDTAAELVSYVLADTAVVGIDEVQFFDDDVVDAAESLATRGIRVIAAGLDQDWRGRPFGPVPALMAVAEYVTKLHAVCARCGAPATRSQRIAASEGQLFVGGAAEYEARCRRCFVPDVARGPSSR